MTEEALIELADKVFVETGRMPRKIVMAPDAWAALCREQKWFKGPDDWRGVHLGGVPIVVDRDCPPGIAMPLP